LSATPAAIEGGSDEAYLVVLQPKGWDELPMLPFIKICRYFNYKQVFGTLSSVCQHFKLLINENKASLSSRNYICLNQVLNVLVISRTATCKSLNFD
jgi:hypothetical protein